jgi:hypothetical protein
LAQYQVGFQTTIYDWSKTNWVLKADPTWNTFATNLPVGPNGMTIRVNSQGLFDVVDPTPLQVQAVYVSGAGWDSAFFDYLGTSGVGSSQLGYRLLGGNNQLAPLPWSNITTLSVVFSQNVTIDPANVGFALTGSADVAPAPVLSGATFSYQVATHVAQWAFAAPLTADRYLLSIPSAALTNGFGLALDGDWTNATATSPGSQFPSGNGTAGGDFNFRFNVLPGDVNQDGTVSFADVTALRSALFRAAGDPAYSALIDVVGAGGINAQDGASLQLDLGSALPTTEPALASGGGVLGSGSGVQDPASAGAAIFASAGALTPPLTGGTAAISVTPSPVMPITIGAAALTPSSIAPTDVSPDSLDKSQGAGAAGRPGRLVHRLRGMAMRAAESAGIRHRAMFAAIDLAFDLETQWRDLVIAESEREELVAASIA